jgi:hypothetical protein
VLVGKKCEEKGGGWIDLEGRKERRRESPGGRRDSSSPAHRGICLLSPDSAMKGPRAAGYFSRAEHCGIFFKEMEGLNAKRVRLTGATYLRTNAHRRLIDREDMSVT